MENKEEGKEWEDSVEKPNLHVTGVPEGEKRMAQKQYLMAENFSKLMKDIRSHIQLSTNPKRGK